MNRKVSITHVIYDVDGTLLDTESIYTEVTQAIVAPFGKTFTFDVKSKMMGTKAHEAAQILVDSLQLPISPEEYMKREKELISKLWPDVKAFEGVEELIHHFDSIGIPQAIATSSYKEVFHLKATKHQTWVKKFSHSVFGDEVHRGKPSPDIYFEAAKRLGVSDMSSVLVFEDALNGVQAAKAAGMNVVAIPHPLFDKKHFHELADQVLEAIHHFDPKEWGLPSLKKKEIN